MLKKKALLIAAGGRALPDVLALFHVQPHLVAYLTSEEGWYGKEGFLSAAKSLDVCKQFHEENNIDAYSIAKGKEACQKILDLYPFEAWDWTFAIGSAPKVMGIAAYEMRDVPVNKPIQLPTSLHASDLLNALETHYHLISIQQTASGEKVCSFTSPEAASLLDEILEREAKKPTYSRI